MEFKDSETFKNLQLAYEYEVESVGEYNIFSAKAHQDVLIEISELFMRISQNNLFIGRRFRNIFNEKQPDTLQNLSEAIATERNADQNMYREYSEIALKEGYNDIASLFNGVANIKLNHSVMLESAATDLQLGTSFCRNFETLWVCLGCGNIMSGTCAPEVCPVCLFPQGYYELLTYYDTRLSNN
ncbi:MAG TPA: rubrerythrin family protein [Clostridiales bacterium]|nr:rubrerythrin family protein [Clostridiales bacterium]